MADEIKIKYQPDETSVFACVRNAAGQVAIVSTGVFETWVDGNVGTYDIPAAEKGGGGMFYANFPAAITTAGVYDIEGFQGATNGTADSLGSNPLVWDGSAEIETSSPLIIPAGYVGDYEILETVYFTFSTNKTLTPGATLKVYKNDDTTPLTTAQATLDTNIGSEVNVHSVSVVLGQANYDKEEDYNVVLSGATVGGETVTAIVGTFSIENRWQAPKHRHIAR